MALFGKKAKDAPAGTAPDTSSSAVAVADDAGTVSGPDSSAAPLGRRAKAARQPKAAKTKTVKSGVAVGLNIGNQFIKAVEVTSKGGDLTVTAMGAVPTPPESYTNGNVLSVSALSNAIKDLWRGAGIKSKVAITSVAGTGALVVRVIEVPKMTDSELQDNMKVDADRYIPFPPSEVVMDFKALRDLPSDPDAPNMEVLLAAAQQEIIDLHVKVVQSAKLDPRAIDVETIAATRALNLERRGGDGYIDYNEVTGVVNLGATGAEISILRGDIVVFTRVVPNGGNAITQAISEGLGLPFTDAERVKIQSADALAPAGYGAGGDFGFGGAGGDFDFGGDDFAGGDFNSAFEDISADPNTAAASDDPFDLDFFNQGPEKDEPGAGHAQKEGEDDNPAPAFSFDFNDPTPAPAPAEPTKDAPGAQPPATDPISFDFGDPFGDEFLPAVDEQGTATPGTEAPSGSDKGTSQLDDLSFDASDTTPLPNIEESAPSVSTPLTSPSPSINEGFSAMIPSAFDFDNFDLPGIQEEGLSTVSTPVSTPAPSVPPANAAPLSFVPETAPPPAPSDTRPASFGLEDDSLATVDTEPAAVAPAAAPDPFDFALTVPEEPPVAPAVASTPAPTFAPEFEEPAAVPALSIDKAPTPATPTTTDDFDLDSIFGDDTPAATPAASAVATPAPAMPANAGDFDLSGIETDLGSFAGGFGDQTDDFSAFGAGLDEGASTDAATLYSLIYPALEELSNEVRRSLEFHLGRYPDATISRLVLHGGGAKLRNIDVFFTQSLGVPTVVANPFAHITVHTPKLPPEYATENGPLCTVALGLALRDFVD
jgi:type IV pilus assembly protein PilM